MRTKENTKKRNRWTPEEDAILREYYPLEGWAIVARLPGRTKQVCTQRASRMGLKAPKNPKWPRWTAEEDAVIREYFHVEGEAVAERLPGRTAIACKGRASQLKVSIARLPKRTAGRT